MEVITYNFIKHIGDDEATNIGDDSHDIHAHTTTQLLSDVYVKLTFDQVRCHKISYHYAANTMRTQVSNIKN